MDGKRLLVVDDSPTVRKLLELTFRGTAWQVDYAATGADALLSVKRTRPEVILLDFMLPDMRGIDVCERLAKETGTASIPIVVMTGKEAAPQIFKNFAAVVACLDKPSTSEQIRKEVEGAALRASASHATAVAAKRPSFARKEAAAKALYAVFRDGFAKIPHWMNELGDTSPAVFFARKLLTPQLTSDLLEALVPHVRALLPQTSENAGQTPDSTRASFQGKIQGWPAAALLNFFECSARTGALTLNSEGKETIAYLRAGEVIAVTNLDAGEYLRGLQRARLKAVPPEVMEAAAAEQRRSGTPVLFTFATQGYFPADALTEALASRGRRLLMAAVAATNATFTWRDLETLPAYVEAHGRHISTSRNTLPFGPDELATGVSSARQQALVELRQASNQHAVRPGLVCTRARGFSELVRQFSLTATERQLLTLVDGRHDAQALAAQTGLETDEVAGTLGCLLGVQLLCEAPAASANLRSPAKSRPVMILEPDLEGFQLPLASLLQSLAEPIRLIDLAGEQDLVAAIERERPRAVFLNPGASGTDNALFALRSRPELTGVAVVVVLEPERAREVKEFAEAGFDTVLVKPIARDEIERLVS